MKTARHWRSVALFAAITAVVLGAGAWHRLVAQDDPFASAKVEVNHVKGNIHELVTGLGGNIGVSVGKDGVLMVDDQFAPLNAKLMAAVKDLGGEGVDFVINTHFHGDHTGGNLPLRKGGAMVVAHDNVRPRLVTGSDRTPAMDPEGLPVITYGETMNIYFNGEEIRLVHLPQAHTDGDTVVHFTGANVVHCGDMLFSGWFPFIDMDGGGSVDGYLAGLQGILDRVPSDARVIAGHGPSGGTDLIRDSMKMIRETRDIVEKRMQAGKSLEEIKSEGLPEKFARWNWRFITTERWIETLHRSLS